MKNKIKKFLGTSLLVGALSLPLKNAQACDDHIPFDVFVRYESSLINSIKNIPFRIRDVPMHPDDWYGEASPIKDDNIKVVNPFVLKARVDKNIPIYKNLGLNLGVNLNFYLVRKSNLRTSEYGANYKLAKPSCDIPDREATYYNVQPAFFSKNNKWFNPSIFSEIETPINEKMNLTLGYELSHQKFIAENGWKDSANKLEDNKRYNLMDLVVGEPYASLKYTIDKDMNLFLDFGLKHLIKKDLTNMGKQMDINYNSKSWFVGIGIGQEY